MSDKLIENALDNGAIPGCAVCAAGFGRVSCPEHGKFTWPKPSPTAVAETHGGFIDQQPISMGFGWLCARCGASHAPYVAGCTCAPPTITIAGGEFAGLPEKYQMFAGLPEKDQLRAGGYADVPRSTAAIAQDELREAWKDDKLPPDWISTGVAQGPYGPVETGHSASVKVIPPSPTMDDGRRINGESGAKAWNPND